MLIGHRHGNLKTLYSSNPINKKGNQRHNPMKTVTTSKIEPAKQDNTRAPTQGSFYHPEAIDDWPQDPQNQNYMRGGAS
jgi:hypothetical protein